MYQKFETLLIMNYYSLLSKMIKVTKGIHINGNAKVEPSTEFHEPDKATVVSVDI